ncbi:Na+/H+ antiporter subunit E [Kushneria phyllosphaerae]|uniref:Na(+)/H(+) antiporter subunit E n=1 Tax=Kushneria phyllosphaerae TaxID=2100822 RepID=A0A2R8CLB8_9GAMM|nr:Na+/H+ antiporter subunit E [Kushneria phyllosphaerae]SPJ33659.1 Na(+)/H(+) antiporter subunit E [Kushneria phyllosphaerae]
MTGLLSNLLLAVAWIALSGDFSMGGMLAGLAFGYLVILLLQNQLPGLQGYGTRLPKMISFVFYFLRELFMANFKVAFDVLTPPWHMTPGVIAFELEAKTDFEIAFVANLISLTPGTLSLDISDDRQVLFIHAMFLDDEQTLRGDLREMERRALAVLR